MSTFGGIYPKSQKWPKRGGEQGAKLKNNNKIVTPHVSKLIHPTFIFVEKCRINTKLWFTKSVCQMERNESRIKKDPILLFSL